MNDDRFWEIVESCKWTSDHDYRRIEKFLLTEYTGNELLDFRTMVAVKREEIYNPLFDIEGVGDDGFSDVLFHIIGMGRETYDNITVEKAQKIIDDGTYEESFSYAIPYRDEIEKHHKIEEPAEVSYDFTVSIRGVGATADAAWSDAIECFTYDPGSLPDAVRSFVKVTNQQGEETSACGLRKGELF